MRDADGRYRYIFHGTEDIVIVKDISVGQNIIPEGEKSCAFCTPCINDSRDRIHISLRSVNDAQQPILLPAKTI